ncbi:hypothetical protein NPIL_503831 [Nephila pilipes]|uniref:Uncharacterized protein n=1 Tax=Nephila pilipes TaxID=299642 RepID=A0A8X6TV02_NEPPI|nr:hypothetical protein NPIL_503831 [Nephila pilipes]
MLPLRKCLAVMVSENVLKKFQIRRDVSFRRPSFFRSDTEHAGMLPFKKSYRAFSLFEKEDQNILHTSGIFSEKYFCIKATFGSCHGDFGFENSPASFATSQRKKETAEEKRNIWGILLLKRAILAH